MKQRFEHETGVTKAETSKLMSYVAALLYLLKFAGDEIVQRSSFLLVAKSSMGDDLGAIMMMCCSS